MSSARSLFERKTPSLWDYEVYSDETRKAKGLCEYILRAIIAREEPFWLSLLGTSGAGKTYLTSQVCDTLNAWPGFQTPIIHRGVEIGKHHHLSTCFVRWKTILDNHLHKGDYRIKDSLIAVDVLFLDDLFSEQESANFGLPALLDILMARRGKWTLITSNLTLEAIKNKEGRIGSRLDRDDNLVFSYRETKDYAIRQRAEKIELYNNL